MLTECCKEPGDNQITLFLHPSLTVGAERQIAGERAEELSHAHARGLKKLHTQKPNRLNRKMVLLKFSCSFNNRKRLRRIRLRRRTLSGEDGTGITRDSLIKNSPGPLMKWN